VDWPTATHQDGDTHETPFRYAPGGAPLAAATALHAVPSHLAVNGSVAFDLTTPPTAMQNTGDVHEIPANPTELAR